MRQGAAITAALWIVSIAVHLGADVWLVKLSNIAGLGASTIAIYLAVTWGTQGAVLRSRARHLGARDTRYVPRDRASSLH
jgi:hypothetical protein